MVECLDRACRDAGLGLVRVGSGVISAPQASRNSLGCRLADVLQGAPDDRDLLRTRAREMLYTIKARLGARRLPPSPWRRVDPPAVPCALVVPREANHLRDLVPVTEAITQRHGVGAHWLVFRTDHTALVPNHWPVTTVMPDGSISCLKEVATLHRQLHNVVAGLADVEPIEGLGFDEWRALLDAALRHLASQLRPMVAAARAIDSAMRVLAPSLVLTGNPTTLEGRLAVEAASAARVPTACIQHGNMLPADPLWRDVPLDLICVWGTRSLEALLATGYRSGQIAVTGAPWTDALAIGRETCRGEAARMVLVAMSGAGHQFSMNEHVRTVERVYRAASRSAQVRWVFRLHPKDDPAIYHRIAATVPGARAEIVAASKSALTIHDQLRGADVLITSGSTAAIDAMLQKVPVLTIARPEGEAVPEYVRMGATTLVGLDEVLEARVLDILERGEAPATARAARDYARAFFGPLDGQATARVAERLAGLLVTARES